MVEVSGPIVRLACFVALYKSRDLPESSFPPLHNRHSNLSAGHFKGSPQDQLRCTGTFIVRQCRNMIDYY